MKVKYIGSHFGYCESVSVGKIYEVVKIGKNWNNETTYFIYSDFGVIEEFHNGYFEVVKKEEAKEMSEYEFTTKNLTVRDLCDTYSGNVPTLEAVIYYFGWNKNFADKDNIKIIKNNQEFFNFLLKDGYIRKVKEVFYKTGDRFKRENCEYYILANIGGSTVVLINLKDGNRWTNPVSVCQTNKITKKEFKCITNFLHTDEFIKIN